jgi:hypothetical protein
MLIGTGIGRRVIFLNSGKLTQFQCNAGFGMFNGFLGGKYAAGKFTVAANWGN